MPTTIASLPVELIVRIAQLAVPESVVAFAATSRGIRAACWDPVVFLAQFRKRAWAVQYLEMKNIEHLARYAVAEAKGVELVQQYGEGDKEGRETEALFDGNHTAILSYLVPLVVMNDPVLDPEILVDLVKYGWTNYNFTELDSEGRYGRLGPHWSLWGLLVSLCVLRTARTLPIKSELGRHLTRHEGDMLGLSTTIRAAFEPSRILDQAEHIEAFHVLSLLSVAQMSKVLHAAYPDRGQNAHLDGRYSAPRALHENHVHPPVFNTIPGIAFHSASTAASASVLEARLEIPPALTDPSAWTHWLRTNRSTLANTPEYFTSGEWVGYYTYGDLSPSSTFGWDAPMHSMHFTLASPGRLEWFQDEGVRFWVHGSGRDGLNAFEVWLGAREDGLLVGRKAYAGGGIHWMWVLSVTPVGLCGFWGRPARTMKDIRDAMGGVWLWKREWSGL